MKGRVLGPAPGCVGYGLVPALSLSCRREPVRMPCEAVVSFVAGVLVDVVGALVHRHLHRPRLGKRRRILDRDAIDQGVGVGA